MPSEEATSMDLSESVLSAFISSRLLLPKSTMSSMLSSHRASGHLNNTPKSGSPRKTTPHSDSLIKSMSENDPWISAPSMK